MALPDLPPASFSPRSLQTTILNAGTKVFRIHDRNHNPIFYGRMASYRFDSPGKDYGVLYAAEAIEGAFVETFLRDPNKDFVDSIDLESRRVAHRLDQGARQRHRLAHSFGQQRAFQLDAVAGVDRRLPVKRQMVTVLRYQHMGQQPGRGHAALDGQ